MENNEIKIGEYIRTIDNCIVELININDYRPENAKFGVRINPCYSKDGIAFLGENIIAKHSPRIIDVLKVGDYVNGFKVISIDHNVPDDRTQCIELELNPDIQYNFISINEIKTVVTKEQFENLMFEV